MKRQIIRIDPEKCNGCGLCISDCPEGALKLIDGKARLVGDLLCDGLGACLKGCPQNAISVEEREAEPYDEIKVLENIIPQGPNVLLAHLKHLQDHGQADLLRQAKEHLKAKQIGIELPTKTASPRSLSHTCPGSQSRALPSFQNEAEDSGVRHSHLTHWPIQLHLISPMAPHYQDSDLLLAADCVAFSNADFHKTFLKGHKLAIACPKLDAGQDAYIEKLTTLIDQAKPRSIKVMIMQVPCCGGLLRLATEAARRATYKPPMSCVVVGLQGEVLSESAVEAP